MTRLNKQTSYRGGESAKIRIALPSPFCGPFRPLILRMLILPLAREAVAGTVSLAASGRVQQGDLEAGFVVNVAQAFALGFRHAARPCGGWQGGEAVAGR